MLKVMTERLKRLGKASDSAQIADWRLHDLRRTGATNLQALGIPIEVTEAVLNHISGTRAGVAGIYNRYKYEPEKRAALDAWNERLGEMLCDKVKQVAFDVFNTSSLNEKNISENAMM